MKIGNANRVEKSRFTSGTPTIGFEISFLPHRSIDPERLSVKYVSVRVFDGKSVRTLDELQSPVSCVCA